MLVVADSSPLNFLIRIGHVPVLPMLFERVAVPPAVAAELTRDSTPPEVRIFMDKPPPWFAIVAPARIEPIAGIDAGEEAAISLAREKKADALLIDDRDGRKAAAARGVAVVGTIGILELAARRGLLNLEEAFSRLARTEFRIRPEYLAQRIGAFRADMPPRA